MGPTAQIHPPDHLRLTARPTASTLTTLLLREDEFFAAVHGLTVKIKKNNKEIIKEITEEEAIDITNFFNNQVRGKPAYNRLSSLVRSYNEHDDGEPYKGVGY